MFVSLYLINGLASIISLYLMCEMSIDLHINCSLSPSPSPLITLFLVFVFYIAERNIHYIVSSALHLNGLKIVTDRVAWWCDQSEMIGMKRNEKKTERERKKNKFDNAQNAYVSGFQHFGRIHTQTHCYGRFWLFCVYRLCCIVIIILFCIQLANLRERIHTYVQWPEVEQEIEQIIFII